MSALFSVTILAGCLRLEVFIKINVTSFNTQTLITEIHANISVLFITDLIPGDKKQTKSHQCVCESTAEKRNDT